MQRREVRVFAVAPLVQAHARSVEEDFAAVFHDRKPDLIRRARLGQPRKPIFRAQPVDRRFFHNRLAVRHGMQLAVQAVALDRERAVLRHEIFQRNFLHALVKVFKALRFELRKQNHHALAHPAAEIRLCHRGKVPVKENAPVFDADVRKVQPFELIADQTLEPKQTRYAECHCLHVAGSPIFRNPH